MGSFYIEKRWLFPLIFTSAVCILFLVTSFNIGLVSSIQSFNSLFFLPSCLQTNQTAPSTIIEETKVTLVPYPAPPSTPPRPRFAYLISGSKGDLEKLWRTLHAVYHPLNHYVLHLDLESPIEERLELSSRVEKQHIFNEIGNVFVITKANIITYRGPTMVANTLHACAIMLKRSKEWDWFINLSASDYPLVTQDDLIYTFQDVDRNLSFIEHTSRLGWKMQKRGMPIIIDPGLYSNTKSDIFRAHSVRDLPTAFRLFTGSAWMILSREFVEFVVMGWDNLPRTLLMYYTNFVSSPEGYFHTVACNVPEFVKTIVNHDLHFITWDIPPAQHPHYLNINDTDKMMTSGAAFARKFRQNDPVLDAIDKHLIHRQPGLFTMGGWCTGMPKCIEVGDIHEIRPGPGAERLQRLVAQVIQKAKSGQNQCV